MSENNENKQPVRINAKLTKAAPPSEPLRRQIYYEWKASPPVEPTRAAKPNEPKKGET